MRRWCLSWGALVWKRNCVSVFEDTSSPAQCWQWLFHLQTGVKHNKTQNLLHKSQSLNEDDWAKSSVRWTPKEEEGWLPDWGNEGKLLGRLDKGRHPVSRVCTVVHGSLDTWKSCTSPTPTMELKMMEIKKVNLQQRCREWGIDSDKIALTNGMRMKMRMKMRMRIVVMVHLRRELQDGDYEAQVSVAARRTWCCADPTTQAGRQSPYLGSVRGTSFVFFCETASITQPRN